MVENSNIEWTDDTFNPWEGCTKVGPGCDHCYAEARADRFGSVQWGAGKPRRLTSDANWAKPLRWNAEAKLHGKRRRVFCASLADVFDNEVPEEWRTRLWQLIFMTPHLDWLLLTKRIGNVKKMLPQGFAEKPWFNVWIGATIVNQQEADRDILKLLATPAAVRFLSMEPLLGPVDLTKLPCEHDTFGGYHNALSDFKGHMGGGSQGNPRIDWVIVGGESGGNARHMHPEWARMLRDQCTAAHVPFLFKQWGEWAPDQVIDEVFGIDGWRKQASNRERYKLLDDKGTIMGRIGKKAAGRILDGRTHDEFPRNQSLGE